MASSGSWTFLDLETISPSNLSNGANRAFDVLGVSGKLLKGFPRVWGVLGVGGGRGTDLALPGSLPGPGNNLEATI